ncbi:hypothetical protein C8R41DRAFT_833216 [Lentinula lateritia]|uniref:Uncharacterized protein n=1 Tax=Lentinula lateritia TaxID=40482 RepID=A0ABQ8VET2_9AGAR|nr:hypothetical protein C8R41DRAFT_833216 [Lentinula lateritia]
MRATMFFITLTLSEAQARGVGNPEWHRYYTSPCGSSTLFSRDGRHEIFSYNEDRLIASLNITIPLQLSSDL